MKEGKNFKVTCDAFVAKQDAKKLRDNLLVNKIMRKQDEESGNTSIRLKTKRNYRKWRIETEVKTLPGNDKIVNVISKEDQILSTGYQTDDSSESLAPIININNNLNHNNNNNNNNNILPPSSSQIVCCNNCAIQQKNQTEFITKAMKEITFKGVSPIQFFKTLQTEEEQTKAIIHWEILQNAQKVAANLVSLSLQEENNNLENQSDNDNIYQKSSSSSNLGDYEEEVENNKYYQQLNNKEVSGQSDENVQQQQQVAALLQKQSKKIKKIEKLSVKKHKQRMDKSRRKNNMNMKKMNMNNMNMNRRKMAREQFYLQKQREELDKLSNIQKQLQQKQQKQQ